MEEYDFLPTWFSVIVEMVCFCEKERERGVEGDGYFTIRRVALYIQEKIIT